jgi:hypothetical protein
MKKMIVGGLAEMRKRFTEQASDALGMWPRLLMVGAAAAAALTFAVQPATAHADSPGEYLSRVQEALPTIYDRYGPTALLNEGNRICSMDAANYSASEEIDAVKRDLPMSEGSAMHLIAIARVRLGC